MNPSQLPFISDPCCVFEELCFLGGVGADLLTNKEVAIKLVSLLCVRTRLALVFLVSFRR